MRQVVFVATSLLLLACGPDPNATLPGEAKSTPQGGHPNTGGVLSNTGGAGPGTGGITSPFATGGSSDSTGGSWSPFAGGGGGNGGGSSPLGNGGAGGVTSNTGGISSTGGSSFVSAVGGNGSADGGTTGTTTGTTPGATSGTTCAGGVPLTSYQFGTGAEPCPPDLDASCGKSNGFNTTGAFCVRTADDIQGWGCSNETGRTVKVNGTAATCGTMPLPAKVGSFYYFSFTAGSFDYASLFWWGTYHTVPAGGYPVWGSSGVPSTSIDAGP